MKMESQTLLLTIVCCVSVPVVRSMVIYSVEDKAPVSYGDGDYGRVGRAYFMGYGCERTELVMSCEKDRLAEKGFVSTRDQQDRYISIVRAVYGRQDRQICYRRSMLDDNWSYPCSSPRKRTTRQVSLRCNGHTRCVLPVVNELFGDPCPNTYKYLQVYYACVTLVPSRPRLVHIN